MSGFGSGLFNLERGNIEMDALAQAMRDLDENKVLELVEGKISGGVPATEIVTICNEGMVAIGELFSQGEYFISQLLFAAEILKGVMKRLDPLLQGTGAGFRVIFTTSARTSSSHCCAAPASRSLIWEWTFRPRNSWMRSGRPAPGYWV
jgi:hypothetical protein